MKLCVDTKKYNANISKIKSNLKKGTKLCAVVKANAYGLGAEKISKATENNVDCFAVAFSREGLKLRELGIKKPILQLSPFENEFLQESIKEDIMLTVFAESQLKDIAYHAKKAGKKACVQIKINSGMNRYGVNEKSVFHSMLNEVESNKNLAIAGVFSHLSGRDKEFATFQKDKFLDMTKNVNTTKHIAASYGTSLGHDFHLDMVRVGIDLIGTGGDNVFQQSVAFKSEIVAFQNVNADEYIGYGDYFMAKDKIKVAIIRGGYADGVNRLIRNGGCVIINGLMCKIVGSVCMDCFFADVSDVKCEAGDSVEIFSENLSLMQYADKIKTIPYEALTQISERVVREYQD